MKKAVWMSYDLGISGDYDGLYAWLADHSAIECGDSMSFFHFQTTEPELVQALRTEIKRNVKMTTRSRIYVIFKAADGKVTGKFLVGKRKQAPWTGYGSSMDQSEDDLDF